MSDTVDLGRVRDTITDVRLTSSLNNVDTYTIYTEAHPEGLDTFQLRNADSVLSYQDFFSLSDLMTWLATNVKKVVSMTYIDEVNFPVVSAVAFLDNAASISNSINKFFRFNGPDFVAITSLSDSPSHPIYIRVFYTTTNR